MSVLRQILTDTITLKKKTEVSIDTEYGIKEESYTEYSVKGLVLPTFIEEVRWVPPGFVEIGDARGFLYPSYTIDEDVITPERGDRIVFEDTEYHIDNKKRFRAYGIEYLECLLRRVMG
jgi:hypothetical protein